MSENKVKIPRNSTKKKPKPVEQETIVVEEVLDNPVVAVKKVFESKVIWVNVLALIALFIQKKYGFVISEELQMQLLTLVNIGLRFITHEKITWK